MFCSKCGKTLPLDAVQCEFCGCTVGESRFEGSPYTSAQSHILPDDDVHQVITQNYTRTNYTSAPDSAEQGDVDARTTYRPTYDGDSMPQEMRRDMRAAVAAADAADEDAPDAPEPAPADAPETDAPDAEIPEEGVLSYDGGDDLKLDDLDLSRFRARPIESAGQSGISADVSEMMQELENEAPRRGRGFRRRADVYGDYTDEDAYADAPEPVPAEDGEQAEVFDDIDEEEFDELRHSSFGLKQILKIVGAVVLVAALIVGGVKWLDYIRSNNSASPIEGVGETLYAEGVALIESHASTANTEKILSDYQSGGSDTMALQTQLNGSAAAVEALLPADATENEQLFISALNQIEKNIANCIISDAIAIGSNDSESIAASDERWTVVNNSIGMLKAATNAVELTAIVNGEVVDIQQKVEATPTPEPAVNYNTLSKGDKSDEVLDMQNRLSELGFLSDTPDGAFGAKTQTAVKIFQQIAGLPVTGIADNATLNALYASDAPRADLAN